MNMEENFQRENCNNDDVLEFSSGTYRINKIIDKVKKLFKEKLGTQVYTILKSEQIDINPGLDPNGNVDYSNWFDRGIDCEILKVNSQGWQKGKVRLKITLEFEADKPEEKNNNHQSDLSLDDIRQIIQ
jgi:hypothetical protein